MNKCMMLFLTMMTLNISFLYAGKKRTEPLVSACDYDNARPQNKKEERALFKDYSAHQPRKTPQSRFKSK